MNIEDIRKNAPFGATDYMILPYVVMYFSKSHGDTMYYYPKEKNWYLYNGAFGYEDIKPLN